MKNTYNEEIESPQNTQNPLSRLYSNPKFMVANVALAVLSTIVVHGASCGREEVSVFPKITELETIATETEFEGVIDDRLVQLVRKESIPEGSMDIPENRSKSYTTTVISDKKITIYSAPNNIKVLGSVCQYPVINPGADLKDLEPKIGVADNHCGWQGFNQKRFEDGSRQYHRELRTIQEAQMKGKAQTGYKAGK